MRTRHQGEGQHTGRHARRVRVFSFSLGRVFLGLVRRRKFANSDGKKHILCIYIYIHIYIITHVCICTYMCVYLYPFLLSG